MAEYKRIWVNESGNGDRMEVDSEGDLFLPSSIVETKAQAERYIETLTEYIHWLDNKEED